MAYGFAISYMYQYPAEKVDPSNFACDTEIRNAKYQSNLQALAVPVSDAEQPMFNMLNAQNFTMTVEFLNTNMDCPRVTVYEVIDSSVSTLALSSCSYTNGTLSMTLALPEHDVTTRIVLDDNQLIGGIRMGLTGAGRTSASYVLQELNFKQAFYSTSARTLSQTATVQVSMTKVSRMDVTMRREREIQSEVRERETSLMFCLSCFRSSTKLNHCSAVILNMVVFGIRYLLTVRMICL